MYFVLAQILFALWAVMFAHFQAPCIKAMREYVPIGNPYTKPFHRRGVILSSMIAVFLLGLLFGVYGWLQPVLIIPEFIGIYKILFDGIIGVEVYGDFYYLGTSSKQDRWVNEHFPHESAGEVKVIFCSIVILLFNILNYLL